MHTERDLLLAYYGALHAIRFCLISLAFGFNSSRRGSTEHAKNFVLFANLSVRNPNVDVSEVIASFKMFPEKEDAVAALKELSVHSKFVDGKLDLDKFYEREVK